MSELCIVINLGVIIAIFWCHHLRIKRIEKSLVNIYIDAAKLTQTLFALFKYHSDRIDEIEKSQQHFKSKK